MVNLPLNFPASSVVKNLPAEHEMWGFDPWVGKIPWKRKWQPTPVFLPGKSHGQWSLAGCSLWGYKELNTTYLVNNNKIYHWGQTGYLESKEKDSVNRKFLRIGILHLTNSTR